MRLDSHSVAGVLSALGFALTLGATPTVVAAQSAAVSSYAASTTDVGWVTGPAALFGPGFTFTPNTNVFVTALSFFNPDDNGGALGFNIAGDPSFGSIFTVVLAKMNNSTNASALAWATVDNSSTVRTVTSGGISGAFFSTLLSSPYLLQAGTLYAVFGGTDQALLSIGAGWDAGVTPPAPVTSPLIVFDNFIGGSTNVSDLPLANGVSIQFAPDPDIAFSTGASFEFTTTTTTTPEPNSVLLLATGLLLFAALTRRRLKWSGVGVRLGRYLLRVTPVAVSVLVVGCAPDDISSPVDSPVGSPEHIQIVINVNVPRVPLALGDRHACALTPAGQAYCWGFGQFGQLGTGTTATSYVPVPVAQGALKFNSLTAAYQSTCALTAIGQAYCWGVGLFFPNGFAVAPTPVSQGLLKFTSIQAGSGTNTFVCALAVGGKAYCWGDNYYGQLGNGVYGCCGGNAPPQPAPMPVAQGALLFTSLTVHGIDVCGLTAGGAAYCWGSNDAGQVGDGNIRPAVPTPTAVQQGSLSFTSLQASNSTTCGLIAGGKMYCWGSNYYGDFANGTGGIYSIPYPTPGALGYSFKSLASLGRGYCGITAATGNTADGQAFCWGWDDTGELGNADTTRATQLLPVPVATAALFKLLASNGGQQMCGLTVAGQVYCWGLNSNGQLGIGNTSGLPGNAYGPFIPYPVLVLTNQIFG